MEDGFIIEVEVKGKEYNFEGRLANVGYTHKFYVLINDLEVTYEPDEERNYRAILSEADQAKVKQSDVELIKAVGDKIQSIR
jgi:hypothetical protein